MVTSNGVIRWAFAVFPMQGVVSIGALRSIKSKLLFILAFQLIVSAATLSADPDIVGQKHSGPSVSDIGNSWPEDSDAEEQMAEEMTNEYVVVTFQPKEAFEHSGNCPLKPGHREPLEPADLMVIVDGSCLGFVGEKLLLSAGAYEFLVDVIGAQMRVEDVYFTTSNNPRKIVVTVSTFE